MTNYNSNKNKITQEAPKLSFIEQRTYTPSPSEVEKGNKTIICELKCRVNLNNILYSIGGIPKYEKTRIHEIIDSYIPITTLTMASAELNLIHEKMYIINEDFYVTGKATCMECDEYDEEKGKRIAIAKAKKKAYHKVFRMISALYAEFVSIEHQLSGFALDCRLQEHIEKGFITAKKSSK